MMDLFHFCNNLLLSLSLSLSLSVILRQKRFSYKVLTMANVLIQAPC